MNFMKCIIASLLVLSVFVLVTPSAFAENVPEWVKNTAGWWADDKISEEEFVNAIEFLVKENIMQVNVSQTSETTQRVPEWVKNTAGWWSTDAISETEFVNAIAYLIKAGIINIESSKSPELIAEMWMDDHITDDEFLSNIERLIEIETLTIPDNSITKTSQLPDWLVNNAGWWAARIITDSDFDFDPGYVNEELYPCIELSTDVECFTRTINSHGFRGDEFQNESVVLTGQEPMKVFDMLTMLAEILRLPTSSIEFIEDQYAGHYVRTPYSYQLKLGRKYIPQMHVDLGQGLLHIIDEMHEQGF